MKINKKVYFLLIAVAIVVAGIIYIVTTSSKGSEEVLIAESDSSELLTDTASDESKTSLFVYVCGEVNKPGVYELKEGSRVFEAVDAAGGLTANAKEGSINLAEVLTDGAQINIPSVIEPEGVEASVDDGLVNLNSASEEDLMTLPGVGESRAKAIIAYREDNGGFKSIEDIMNVSGIKEASFSKIKSLIKV